MGQSANSDKFPLEMTGSEASARRARRNVVLTAAIRTSELEARIKT